MKIHQRKKIVPVFSVATRKRKYILEEEKIERISFGGQKGKVSQHLLPSVCPALIPVYRQSARR